MPVEGVQDNVNAEDGGTLTAKYHVLHSPSTWDTLSAVQVGTHGIRANVLSQPHIATSLNDTLLLGKSV